MPIYEYVCRSCGHEIEKLQGMSDAPLSDCQACGEAALKRKVSAPSFRLAGDGWYETDFKQDGKRNLAGDQSTASSASSADDSGSKKTESKSDSKSEDKSAAKSSGSNQDSGSSKSKPTSSADA